ncbi:GNAT family N-acetyltransferase [Clostridium sp. YIM B02515]|uniref:GNAT family N-acetyltransferase n=1 Tax=Clostridium rhizosphaerae TaxID=2803861 RepID=A0ABS1TDJ9_9CLOT|nr:GNAT family N-acetyltransferase [Clostridium rhizosphaerae]MBL4936847.1 GNAT family N-acetyltransferase [Clostridium rhizosphaerae]
MESNFNVEYVKISRENPDRCRDFLNLGYEYMKEIAADMPVEIHDKFLNSILSKQFKNKRWLIGLIVNDNMVGFIHFKVDESERIGWGYILEFYIMPDFRRKGLGRKLYNFAKETLISCGIKDVWLSADKVNGESFWFSMGFIDTEEMEEGQKILKIMI